MAKTKTKKRDAEPNPHAADAAPSPAAEKSPAAGAVESIETISGLLIPVSEVQHIAPELRRFAVPTESLRFDPRNARAHGARDLEATQKSLETFGQQHLIHYAQESTTTGSDRIVKVGNGRLTALRKLGHKYVAAIETNLSGDALKAFALADNRTGELAGWNVEELELQTDELLDVGFDLDALGMGEDDLDEMMGEDEEPEEKSTSSEREGNAPRDAKPQWKIMITCKSETEQARLINLCHEQNIQCKALIS